MFKLRARVLGKRVDTPTPPSVFSTDSPHPPIPAGPYLTVINKTQHKYRTGWTLRGPRRMLKSDYVKEVWSVLSLRNIIEALK